jgi:hypothetical protein
MQCFFHSSQDPEDSCLLGGKKTICGFYRCYQTVGKSCSIGHEMKLNGQECGKDLICGELVANFKFEMKVNFNNLSSRL